MENEQLVKAALEARSMSYAPYSKFRVGAAILCEDGTVVKGGNIENSSYGVTICAERTAAVKALSEGCGKFKKLAVVSSEEKFTYPCGICRQVIVEFAESKEIPIIIIKSKEEYIVKTMEDILPGAFTKIDLDKEKEVKNV